VWRNDLFGLENGLFFLRNSKKNSIYIVGAAATKFLFFFNLLLSYGNLMLFRTFLLVGYFFKKIENNMGT